MIRNACGLAIAGFLLLGCATGQPTAPTGYLSQDELDAFNAERQKIVKECRAKHDPLESEVWTCLGELVPLTARMGPEFSRCWANYLKQSRRVARSFERGKISEQVALSRMSRMVGQLVLEMQQLDERIDARS